MQERFVKPNKGKGNCQKTSGRDHPGIQETYSASNLDITSAEVADIAHLTVPVDVMELRSPKRFTAVGKRYKLRPGFAFDLCEGKADGTHWDQDG